MVRNSDKTRKRILTAAQEEIHKVGFQAASLNTILNKTGLTKGAFYHHFRTKNELGYALVDECIREEIRTRWIRPISDAKNPIEAFIQNLTSMRTQVDECFIKNGCPLNNLAQEMSLLDEDYRKAIYSVYEEWILGIQKAFGRGQDEGTVRKDIDLKSTATFIVSYLEGSIGLAKNAQSIDILDTSIHSLFDFLNSLKTSEA